MLTLNWNWSGETSCSFEAYSDARDAAEDGAERERGELGLRGVDAHVPRGELVLADRDPGAPDAAVADVARQDDRQHDQRERQVEIRAADRIRTESRRYAAGRASRSRLGRSYTA